MFEKTSTDVTNLKVQLADVEIAIRLHQKEQEKLIKDRDNLIEEISYKESYTIENSDNKLFNEIRALKVKLATVLLSLSCREETYRSLLETKSSLMKKIHYYQEIT